MRSDSLSRSERIFFFFIKNLIPIGVTESWTTTKRKRKTNLKLIRTKKGGTTRNHQNLLCNPLPLDPPGPTGSSGIFTYVKLPFRRKHDTLSMWTIFCSTWKYLWWWFYKVSSLSVINKVKYHPVWWYTFFETLWKS